VTRFLRRRERGQVFALTGVLLMLVVLPMLGLAIDAGTIFNTQRKLQMTADAAARIGAMQLDQTAAREAGVARLDPDQAETQAEQYLGTSPGVHGSATADAAHVEVVAQREAPAPFHTLLKLPVPMLTARSQAVPCPGIATSEGSC
jgi:Flp pilus assembly protein TadG